jgi:phosphoketolase
VKRAAQALALVAQHGIVLASAKGTAPRLIDAIAGEVIAGNWWSHPQANTIYNVLTEVQASQDILVCRLLGGKITLVHRRLWPALVRAAETFAPQQIARVSEEHTASGRHVVRETPFPQWVPVDVLQQAQALSEEQALRALGLGAG